MASGWLDRGKTVGYLTTVLQVKADQKYTIRLLNDDPPVQLWRHACRDTYGKFVKALCVGNRNGCKLCERNAEDRFAGLKNKDKPYPIASEYVKVVWVYQEKRPMLIVGNDIWRQLDVLFAQDINITDRDFSIVRSDQNKRVTYQVIALAPAPFTETVDMATMPTPESYKGWLMENVQKVALPTVGGADETPEDPEPEKFVGGEEPKAHGPQGKTESVTAERKALVDKVVFAITHSFNAGVVGICRAKILEARKTVNPKCSLDVEFDAMSEAELQAFLDMYKVESKNK